VGFAGFVGFVGFVGFAVFAVFAVLTVIATRGAFFKKNAQFRQFSLMDAARSTAGSSNSAKSVVTCRCCRWQTV
jgi:hypothetical protein